MIITVLNILFLICPIFYGYRHSLEDEVFMETTPIIVMEDNQSQQTDSTHNKKASQNPHHYKKDN